MYFQTELRIFVDREKDIYGDIINIDDYVVNIKNLTISKEGKKMLDNEKTLRLEQLRKFKSEYLNKLEEIRSIDVSSLINEKLAQAKEDIEKQVVSEYEALIAKTLLKIESIDEMIAETEAIEVEETVAVNEEDIVKIEETDEVSENAPVVDCVEVNSPVDEFQEERPVI